MVLYHYIVCNMLISPKDTLFHEFIGELLMRMQPFPGNNSVIVMDNACIHKNQEVIDMIEERYHLALL